MYLKNTRKNMKKIFFIFAMMFMSLVSALAQESSEPSDTLCLDLDTYEEGGHYICTGPHFIVEGELWDASGYFGMYIHNGNKITVRSKTGETITKVEYVISTGSSSDRALVRATPGDVVNADYIINNVNATDLVINSDAEKKIAICELVVYYEPEGNGGEEGNTSISEDYILFESFDTTNGTEYEGNKVQVTGTEANVNGLSIGNGKTVTISNIGNDTKIFKVELNFINDFNGTFNNLNGCVIDGSGKNWTISNIYLPDNLTISSSDGSGQINNVTVYYVKMSEEKSVTIATNTGPDYIEGEGHIKVSGTKSNAPYGLDIDKGGRVTITSIKGAEISKVKLQLNWYYGPDKIATTAGIVVKGDDDNHWTISNINSSSLTISHPGNADGVRVQIGEITVYYKEPIVNSTMEVVANAAEGFYWTTFYSNASNYVAPENTQVFKVSLDGRKITMTEIEDRIVNRYQGVVLKSTTGNITMSKTDNKSSDGYVGNSLKGTSVKITNPGNAYVLGYKTSAGVAFYKLSSNGTLAANKAYLQANSSNAAHAFFTFDVDETATGVDNIYAQDSEEDVDVKIYDLQGRRVAKPTKGIYIVNGKKVLMK